MNRSTGALRFSAKPNERPPTMKLHRLAAAAALAAMSLHAQAQSTTYEFTFTGTQTHFRDDWECPGSVCAPGTPLVTVSPWAGTLTLTAPEADGTYTEATFASLSLLVNGYGLWLEPFMAPAFGVTIEGGQVASFFGVASAAPQTWAFSGTTVHWSQPAQHHYGQTFGDAQIAAVPEPETWALFAAGLLVTARIARRRKVA